MRIYYCGNSILLIKRAIKYSTELILGWFTWLEKIYKTSFSTVQRDIEVELTALKVMFAAQKQYFQKEAQKAKHKRLLGELTERLPMVEDELIAEPVAEELKIEPDGKLQVVPHVPRFKTNAHWY